MSDFKIEVLDGREVKVYESGLVLDASTGRIVKPAPGTLVRTAAQANELHRRRREKAQRLTRARIVEAMNDGLLPPGTRVTDSAEATAEAAAVLWAEVVMNHDAYPRDRVITFDKLTQMMGTSPAPDASDGTPGTSPASQPGAGEAATILARVLADVLRVQAGGTVTDFIDGTTSPAPASQPGTSGDASPAPARHQPPALPADASQPASRDDNE